jgi:hypothetical protein
VVFSPGESGNERRKIRHQIVSNEVNVTYFTVETYEVANRYNLGEKVSVPDNPLDDE